MTERAWKTSSPTWTVCGSPSEAAGSNAVALSVMKRAPNRSAWSRMDCISSGPTIPSRKPG
jgi:hypothetical protein